MARIHFSKYIIVAIFTVNICSYWSYGTAGAPNRGFSFASSFSMVNGSIETKIGGKIGKNLENPVNFHGWMWPKFCLNWPNVVPLVPPKRYFDG